MSKHDFEQYLTQRPRSISMLEVILFKGLGKPKTQAAMLWHCYGVRRLIAMLHQLGFTVFQYHQWYYWFSSSCHWVGLHETCVQWLLEHCCQCSRCCYRCGLPGEDCRTDPIRFDGFRYIKSCLSCLFENSIFDIFALTVVEDLLVGAQKTKVCQLFHAHIFANSHHYSKILCMHVGYGYGHGCTSLLGLTNLLIL